MFRFLNKIILFFAVTVCTAIISSGIAYAQKSNFPEFSLSENMDKDIVKNDVTDTVPVVIKRPLTRDILLLQEQINILTALVKRQSEISKIADNYEKIGIPFLQPKPELSTCQKLPENLLCIYSYPNMEKNTNFFNEVASQYQQQQNAAMMEAINEITQNMQPQQIAASIKNNSVINNDFDDIQIDDDYIQSLVPAVEKDEYVWADIQCFQSKCTALLISTDNPNDRLRVSGGQHVNEYIKIHTISPQGVTAKVKDDIKDIKPMALEGMQQVVNKQKQPSPQPFMAPNATPSTTKAAQKIANINIQDAFIGSDVDLDAVPQPNTPTTPPVQKSINEPVIAPAPAPLLGPTGLF